LFFEQHSGNVFVAKLSNWNLILLYCN